MHLGSGDFPCRLYSIGAEKEFAARRQGASRASDLRSPSFAFARATASIVRELGPARPPRLAGGGYRGSTPGAEPARGTGKEGPRPDVARATAPRRRRRFMPFVRNGAGAGWGVLSRTVRRRSSRVFSVPRTRRARGRATHDRRRGPWPPANVVADGATLEGLWPAPKRPPRRSTRNHRRAGPEQMGGQADRPPRPALGDNAWPVGGGRPFSDALSRSLGRNGFRSPRRAPDPPLDSTAPALPPRLQAGRRLAHPAPRLARPRPFDPPARQGARPPTRSARAGRYAFLRRKPAKAVEIGDDARPSSPQKATRRPFEAIPRLPPHQGLGDRGASLKPVLGVSRRIMVPLPRTALDRERRNATQGRDVARAESPSPCRLP